MPVLQKESVDFKQFSKLFFFLQDSCANDNFLVTATDANKITSVSLTKTFRIEESKVPELLYCDQVAR